MSIKSSVHIARSSIIESGAVLGENVRIGPFSIISDNVTIGADTLIGSHCIINGLTSIGCKNYIGDFCSIGEINQDLKYASELTKVVIGDRNVLENNVTIHRGTIQGHGTTVIGHDNHFMSNVHVGHDCIVGDHTEIGVNSGLAGHVELGDGAILGIMCAIHQYCVLGSYAKIADHSGVVQDVPPFVLASGNHAQPAGLDFNSKGCTELNVYERILLQNIYDMLYHQSLPVQEVKQIVAKLSSEHQVAKFFDLFFTHSLRGIIRV